MDIHFYHQFKETIENGTKIQTFRNSTRFKVGDSLNLIVNPYNKDRMVVKIVTVCSVIPIEIDNDNKLIKLGNKLLNKEGVIQFSHNEGFNSEDDMWQYINNHQCFGRSYLFMWEDYDYSQYFKPIIVSYKDINNNTQQTSMNDFNYTIKKNLILFIALQPERIYAIKNGLMLMLHGHKVKLKYSSSTNLCSVRIKENFHQRERILKDIPINKVIEVIYNAVGKHPYSFKFLRM